MERLGYTDIQKHHWGYRAEIWRGSSQKKVITNILAGLKQLPRVTPENGAFLGNIFKKLYHYIVFWGPQSPRPYNR